MIRGLILLLTLVLASCGGITSRDVAADNVMIEERQLAIIGTVKYVGLEGGFFGVIGDDGTRYDPINLPASFAVDGLRVKAQIQLRPDSMGFHMWGEMVEIIQIEGV